MIINLSWKTKIIFVLKEKSLGRYKGDDHEVFVELSYHVSIYEFHGKILHNTASSSSVPHSTSLHHKREKLSLGQLLS